MDLLDLTKQNNMRKFRLINSDGYNFSEKGKIYRGIEFLGRKQVFDLVEKYPEDWQEVFDEHTKPLHKDTDLGHFAGVVLRGILADRKKDDYPKGLDKTAINIAKELIKQLDEETK